MRTPHNDLSLRESDVKRENKACGRTLAQCLGPVSTVLRMQHRSDIAQWPFNRILRELGISRGDAFDEFDTAGLHRHRRKADWAQTAGS